jgi:hypothetical protein
MFKVVFGVSTCDLGLIDLERHGVCVGRKDGYKKVKRGRGEGGYKTPGV